MSNKGIDCNTAITAPVADNLVSLGYGFVMRYINRMTASEAQILTDAGLLIGCVYETTATRAQGGAANGAEDGAVAFSDAQKLNVPTSACIFFAVDYDAQSSDMQTVAEYLKAAKVQIGNYMIGVYGSYSVVEAMRQRGVADVLWQTYAWSGGQKPVNATVYQYKNDQTVAGIFADLDEAYSTAGMWNYLDNLVASIENKLKLSSPTVWADVVHGRTTVNGGIYRALFEKVCKVIPVNYTADTIAAIVASNIALNSVGYWTDVMADKQQANAGTTTALFKQIDIYV